MDRTAARAFGLLTVAYAVAVALGVVVLEVVDRHAGWLGAVVALVAAAPAIAMVVVGPVRASRREGVERTVLSASAAIAFFVTMAALLTYGLLEAFADVQRVTTWWFYGFGMIAWAVASVAIDRRFR